jgi:hypothetical protein
MNFKIVLLLLLLMVPGLKMLGQTIKGKVFEMLEGNKVPLAGTNIYQLNTTNGTTSDEQGEFSLKIKNTGLEMLVFSYVGYVNDTIHLHDSGTEKIEIVMREQTELAQVEIVSGQRGNYVSRASTLTVETVSSAGLKQAACCNLSESFENSASVNVNYSDAITGAKHIEMLGLAGKYTVFMQENIPNLRGLAGPFGLGYYPGDWMQSIQVSKGASTVVNGYESITGQINIELKKPSTNEIFFLNMYINSETRFEANAVGTFKLNDKWSSMLFGHYNQMQKKIDENGDGFLDMPLMRQLNLFNRWTYESNGTHFEFGVKYLNENREGGQYNYNPEEVSNAENGYGFKVKTNRAEANIKLGHVFKNRDLTSLGFQSQFTWQDQKSFYGLNVYGADQTTVYNNLLFQSYINNSIHQYTTGLSYYYTVYNQKVNDSVFNRTESVPGGFFQYTYSDGKKLNIIAGIREDYNSEYGWLFTPRIHLRYSFNPQNIFRANAGKGHKPVNVIAENTSLFLTSKTIQVLGELDMESAWNYGISYTRFFNIGTRELSFIVDYFYTHFENQTIVDRETEPNVVYIYNLKGESYSHSIQGELQYEAVKNLNLTLAFRYNDVKTTINNQLMAAPMINVYKGLFSASYQTNLKKWQFDANVQLNGNMPLPTTSWNPPEYQRPDESPTFVIVNAQVTKFFKKFEVYLGGENLTNYRQPKPIIAADDPFGEYFDATIIYGPISGIKVYAGFRYTLKK